jgi:hypothetical protein
MKTKSKHKQDLQQSTFSHAIPDKEQLRAIWEEEIKRLNEKKFATLDEGVQEITDLVLKRLNFNTNNKELKIYLELLLKTDPFIIRHFEKKNKVKDTA